MNAPRLLIVEDSIEVAEYLKSLLEGTYQLSFAGDGQTGIDYALENVPDIIISDVMMPRKNGLELCQTLKMDERSSHIPIILLTAKADVESRIAGLERGADVYLAKPFNKKELFVSLRKLVEIRKRLRERYSKMEAPPSTTDPVLRQEDLFMKKVREIIESNLDNENFSAPELCRAVGMGRTNLYAKIKALTDHSPARLIRNTRLTRAKELLKTSDLNISQIAFEVGFQDPAYFSRAFSKEFGISPNKYRNSCISANY